MNAPSEIRSQLQTLRIPKDQRPSSRRGRGGRVWGRLFMLLLIAGLAGGAYLKRDRIKSLSERVTAPAAVEVRLVPVTVRRGAETPPVLTATGKIVSDHQVEVATKVSGQIVALYFEQGDRVESGRRLARIEDVIYRARRDQAAAQLEKSKAHLDFQQINFQRTERLFRDATAAEIEYADAKRAVEEARAQVEADEAALQWAQKSLNDCEVVAPIAGVILERNVEVGDFVAAEGGRGAMANSQFAAIADMSKLRVEVDISELDVARLRREMPCTVIPEAYKDRRYRGRIMWIDPGANYSKATVQVKVRIEDPDDYLRVEGSAQVVFLSEEPTANAATQPARIWIPAAAHRVDPADSSPKVFVAVDGRLQERSITIGRQAGGQVEVLSGLEEGQQIATGDLSKLRSGQPLKP